MSFKTLIGLSVAAGATITLLEFLLVGHTEPTSIENPATLFRVAGTTAVATALLCLVVGLLGSRLSQLLGVSRDQAVTAGVLGAALPAAFYVGAFRSLGTTIFFCCGSYSEFLSAFSSPVYLFEVCRRGSATFLGRDGRP